jgi:hypothetical protein
MATYIKGTNLQEALAALGDAGESTIDTGLTYRPGEAVLIRVRHRGRRYDITDDGAAVAKAGKPAGWLHDTERVVAGEGFNVNRSGVIFVPAVEGRDIASLTLRLAQTSRTVYLTLLDAAGAAHARRQHAR